MSLIPVESLLRGLLIPFANKYFIGTVNDIAKFTSHDRTAIKKYLEFYVDIMILIRYRVGERDYYTVNRKYLDLYKDSDILKELTEIPTNQNKAKWSWLYIW